VWLDRGELDKIIDRERGERRDERQYDRRYDDKQYKPKKKESIFERFLDFD
jgi:Zn-finger nucleic acid-binding protein